MNVRTIKPDHKSPPWMDDAACKGINPSVFFPSDGAGVEVAAQICEGCPQKHACLEFALDHRIDHGVWGGTSERQRRRILRERDKKTA